MKAFKATYIINPSEKETVLVIEVLMGDAYHYADAVFVHSDGTMSVDNIQHFKDCQPNWEEK